MGIIRAVNSEKSARLLEKGNKVTLIVDQGTGKESLREELKTVYGLKVVKINIMNTFGNHKKAIVTLDKSHTADEIAVKFGLIV